MKKQKQRGLGGRGEGKKSRKYRRQKEERFIIQKFNIPRRLYSVPQIYSVATSAGLTCLTPCSPGLSFPLKRRGGKDMVLFTQKEKRDLTGRSGKQLPDVSAFCAGEFCYGWFELLHIKVLAEIKNKT